MSLIRVIHPGHPHHLTQRGTRREVTFFCEDDYQLYLSLLRQGSRRLGVAIWAWCLMLNHVHLVAVPPNEASLSALMRWVHASFSKAVNRRQGWTGHLWQGPYRCYPMDETHLFHAVLYIERNPVVAGLVERPEQWPWSSARARMGLAEDCLVDVADLVGRWPFWRDLGSNGVSAEVSEQVERHLATGLPRGTPAFIRSLEELHGRPLTPRAMGRPSKGTC